MITLLILLAQTLTIGAGGGDLVVSGGTGTFEPDPYFNRIPLYYKAGRVAFTCGGTAAGSVRWESHGKYLTALAFDSTFTDAGVVYLETNLANPTLTFVGQLSDVRFVGDLSVFRRLNYSLQLWSCNPTGDLSSVSAVTYYLRLANCAQVTGNLSSVSGVSYLVDLFYCPFIIGDLSSVAGVTFYLRLSFLAGVTGILTPTPTLANVILDGCTGITPANMSQSLVNLANVTTVVAGTFSANHIKRSQLTPAAELAVQHLVAAPHNWAMTFKAE
jgi:hypothetical protein